MSPFEFFCNLDVNTSGKLSKIEFKTGLQAFGFAVSTKEFDQLWKMIKKPVRKLPTKTNEDDAPLSSRRSTSRSKSGKTSTNDDEVDSISYFEVLSGFINAGCFKYQKSIDNTNNLVNKFRVQLKKRNISVEKAYKQFDPEEYVFSLIVDNYLVTNSCSSMTSFTSAS